ncbi:MAG: hypothetical protein KGJ66_13100 [Alphaproteobacteria bacterium]|nr:hypothetical protein [Alphaproteobacteria bacterium]
MSVSKFSVAVAAMLVLATAAVAVYAWNSLGGVAMPAAGYVALIFGFLGTLGLAAVLIGLMFYSHDNGFDDGAGGPLADKIRDDNIAE